MERGQITFYRSFWEAAKLIQKPADRLSYLEAVLAFGLDGENRPVSKAAAPSFSLVKPVLEAAMKKARGGRKRGNNDEDTAKTIERCDEDSGKIVERYAEDTANKKEGEKEKEKEIEKEKEKEKESYILVSPAAGSACARENDLAEVMTFFLDKINATPGPTCTGELKAFTETLGAPVILHALEIALNEKKTSWSYIKAILQRYTREGLNTLEAVRLAEQAREQSKEAAEKVRRPSKITSAAAYEAKPPERLNMADIEALADKI